MQFRIMAVCAVLIAGTIKMGVSRPNNDHATRSGQTIILNASGASFDVPTDWVDWYQRFHNNFHLSAGELAQVKDGYGEWDTEYAEVVNSVLSFDDCSAHVGGEGWGKEGVSFADVQLRVYETSLSEDEVHQAASAKGLFTAQKVGKEASSSTTFADGPWHRTTITYSLFYGDYGGTARIDFYTRTIQGRSLVLVFMYCDTNRFGEIDEVAGILRSFQLQSSKRQ